MQLVQFSVQWYWSQFHEKAIYLAVELPFVEGKKADKRWGKEGTGINKPHAHSASGLMLDRHFPCNSLLNPAKTLLSKLGSEKSQFLKTIWFQTIRLFFNCCSFILFALYLYIFCCLFIPQVTIAQQLISWEDWIQKWFDAQWRAPHIYSRWIKEECWFFWSFRDLVTIW